jgi:CRISPR type I-E-associated protein CasB/Cse2
MTEIDKSTHPVKEDKYPEVILRFINRLSALERGEIATLKRNTGNTIAESRNCAGLFYKILPNEIAGVRDEEIYFLVATLFGLNTLKYHGDFGSSLHLVKIRTSSEGIDRRMAILLDSEFDLVDGFRSGGGELAYRLRQCVKLAAGHEVGIDWPKMLYDLTWWSHPEKRVRKQWARSYYGSPENETQFNNEIKGGE